MGNRVFWCAIGGFLSGVGYASIFGASVWHAGFVLSVSLAAVGGYASVKRPEFLCACACCLAVALGIARAVAVPSALPSSFLPLVEKRADLEGTIVTQPDLRETSARLMVEVGSPSAGGEETEPTRIIASAPPHGTYVIGDRVRVAGTLSLPEPFATDGGRSFAYDKFLAKDGVFGVVQPAYVEVVGKDGSVLYVLMRPLQAAREGFMRALGRALPEPESALAAGLVVGGKQGLGEQLLDDFTVAGLLPIVVLSGYNVMIIAEGILRALSFLPKRWSLALAAVSISLFVLAAGAGASSIRAGLMALMALLARATGRTYAVVRALFVTLVVMVLASPLTLVFDPGLQFSFVATLGLILGNPIVERRLRFIRNDFMRDISASTIAAQIAVLPLLLYQTGNLSLVSVAANILVLPVIPAAMAASGIAAAFALMPGVFFESFIDPLSQGVGLPAFALLRYVIMVAEYSAQLPLASIIIPKFPFWVMLIAYAFLAIVVMRHLAIDGEHEKQNAPGMHAAGASLAR
jgi:competence protein ComEC